MIAWELEAFGIEPAGYPVRVVNEVDGWEKTIVSEASRAELIERLLFGGVRSARQYDWDWGAVLAEPLSVCIYIKADEIVALFYTDGDPVAAREVIRAMQGKEGSLL